MRNQIFLDCFFPDSFYGTITERRKSKKCSIFDTINENVNYRENNDSISNEISVTRLRKGKNPNITPLSGIFLSSKII